MAGDSDKIAKIAGEYREDIRAVIEGRAQWCVVWYVAILGHAEQTKQLERGMRVVSSSIQQIPPEVAAGSAVLFSELQKLEHSKPPSCARSEYRAAFRRTVAVVDGRQNHRTLRSIQSFASFQGQATVRAMRRREIGTTSQGREHAQQRRTQHRKAVPKMSHGGRRKNERGARTDAVHSASWSGR